MGAQVLAVVGARGGVGTSTLAALVARRLAAAGGPVVLVDLDPSGGGIDVLLGTEAVSGARWADLALARDPLDAADLRGLLPRWQGVDVLGHDRRSAAVGWGAGGTAGSGGVGAVGPVWSALLRGWRDVVLDVPRAAVGDDGLAPVLEGCARVVVTSQDVPGVAAALGVRDALGAPSAQVVVRRRRGATVAPVQVARATGMRLGATLPHVRALAGAVDRGLGPGVVRPGSGLGRAAARVVAVARG